jgi:hypothetical protein
MWNRGRHLALLTLGAWTIAASANAQSKVTFTRQAPAARYVSAGANALDQPPGGITAWYSDSNCQSCGGMQQAVADNFLVNEPGGAFQVGEIVIWGVYVPGNVPSILDLFDIRIHEDASGVPGPVVFLLQNIQATSRVIDGSLGNTDQYRFTFDFAAPPVLPNGSYWVEITNDTAVDPGNDFAWREGILDPVHGLPDSLISGTVPGVNWQPELALDFSLEINGTSMPVELQTFSVE